MARTKHKPAFSTRVEILEAQSCRCAYCNIGLWEADIEWDHFIPAAWKRDNSKENMVAACRPCNQAKKARLFASEADLAAFCLTMIKNHGSMGFGTPEGVTARFLA